MPSTSEIKAAQGSLWCVFNNANINGTDYNINGHIYVYFRGGPGAIKNAGSIVGPAVPAVQIPLEALKSLKEKGDPVIEL